MRNTLLALISLFLLASCSPRVIEKVDKQVDTLYQVRHLRDSVYLRDSVSTSIRAAGDTIYVDRYRSTIRYKERLKIDTVKQVREVTKVDTKVVEVKKKNGKFQIFIFGLLSGSLLLLIFSKNMFHKK